MFGRVTEFQVKTEKIDKATELYRNSVVPVSKRQKGYIGTYVMVNRQSGKGISLTCWESEGDALANEKNLYYQQQLIKFLNFLEKPAFTRELYDVVLKD